MRDGHPAEGVLRAYADGELRWPASWHCARHLRACAGCRGRMDEGMRADGEVSELLERMAPPVDPREGWARLQALAGGGGRTASRIAPRLAAFAGATVLGLGALVFLLRAGGEADDSSRAGGRILAAGVSTRVRDLCCWDLDGGGPGDDGLLAVALPGERVIGVAVYEDRNGSGTLSDEDLIRFGLAEVLLALRREAVEAPGRDRAVVRDLCCADVDGGGRRDDGIYTVNRPGEVVDQVVLYEDRDGSGGYTTADLDRYAASLGRTGR